MDRRHVMIVGAAGVFGSRLARLLAGRRSFALTLAGRSTGKMGALRQELLANDPEAEIDLVALDRDTVTADDLRRIGCDIVVDCSGPFQSMGTNLIDSAIAAGCHYVDLADSRAFIAEIGRFDTHARARGVVVIAGASSSPAISNAALDHMATGWRGIDTIDCAIVPGNQTPKGRSVIAGILSWVGQPLRVFRDGGWQEQAGWTGARWVRIDGLSRRRAMLADVPDLDVLVGRFSPRIRAGFDAGMELPVLNWLIGLCGLAIRWRLFGSARIFAGIGFAVANLLDRFGSPDGGMLVEVAGVDDAGLPRRMEWQLRAGGGHGPYVPVGPAAAIVTRILAGTIDSGARSAAGLVGIDEIMPWYDGLQIEATSRQVTPPPSVFGQVLGEDFQRLPEVTQRLHRGQPAIVAVGEAVVQPAQSSPGRIIARLFGLPGTPGRVPVRVVIESRDGSEYWTRSFGSHRMRSVMQARGGLIEERFGPVAIRMHLVAHADGLDMLRAGGSMFGIPLPALLLPSIKAEERVDASGRHLFEVEIGLPLIGRLVAYQGHLDV